MTPKTSDEKILVNLIKESQLSQVAAALSKSLKLPANITIAVTRTQAGPYFDPKTNTIDFNLPFAALMFRVITSEYPKITPYNFGVAFASLQYFVLFHEIGHALIHAWHIPVLGREEDAVDAFSTIFMVRFVQDGQIALWGADFFNAVGSGHKYGAVDFADEHSLSPQRAYSIACWVYGSDEKKYAYLAKILPKERAATVRRRVQAARVGLASVPEAARANELSLSRRRARRRAVRASRPGHRRSRCEPRTAGSSCSRVRPASGSAR